MAEKMESSLVGSMKENGMKKIILPIILCIGLSGCADFRTAWDALHNANITPRQVYIAANAFDAVEGTATNYLVYCHKKANCSKSAVDIITPAVRSGRLARNKLEAQVDVDPNALVDANLFNMLTASTDTLKQIIAEYSIGAAQ